MTMFKDEPTHRGFANKEFIDRYGEECSIQKSSIATEDCIWFGVNRPEIKLFQDGRWIEDAIDKELLDSLFISGRMHLTREMVQEMLPILQHFANTGDLK